MSKIKFIEDFATRSKGDVWENCDSMLASHLVHIDKVAVYLDAEPVEESEKKKTKK
jgi:hypothetical protein